MVIKVGTFTLSEKDYDKRDYLASNVIKDFNKIEVPAETMRGISETYYQGPKLGACTAYSTTHSMKSQNEKEINGKVDINPLDLRAKMGHSLTKYDGGDSVENAVKTALKEGISGFSSMAWCYGKRDSWKQALQLFPLITVIYGTSTTRKETLDGEVKTIGKRTAKTLGHAIMLAGYDRDWVYFINSFGDKINKNGISNFKISKANFEKAISIGMINRRWFSLADKDLKEFAKHIELSKQAIKPLKKLYEIADNDIKKYLEDIGLTKKLEQKYSFKYE